MVWFVVVFFFSYIPISHSSFKYHFLYRNGSDSHIPDFPTVVSLQYRHNHNVLCADALKHRDVSKETKEKLIELFHRKHGPTSALDTLQYELQIKHGDEYYKVAADRAVCPDLQYCCR